MRCLFDDPYPLANGSILKVYTCISATHKHGAAITNPLPQQHNFTSLSCHKKLPQVQHPVQKGVWIYQPLYSAPSINHLNKIMSYLFSSYSYRWSGIQR